MRVEFSKILAQTVQDRNPVDFDIEIPPPVTYGRSEKIGEIKQQALDFAGELLLNYDLPSNPVLKIGRIKGFEDKDRPLIDIVGVIHVNAAFLTNNHHKIRMELAIPLVRGQLQKPSIACYKNKKYVFSQEFLDMVIQSYETVRPKITKQYGPHLEVQHRPTMENSLYSAPNDPTQWSLLITERY